MWSAGPPDDLPFLRQAITRPEASLPGYLPVQTGTRQADLAVRVWARQGTTGGDVFEVLPPAGVAGAQSPESGIRHHRPAGAGHRNSGRGGPEAGDYRRSEAAGTVGRMRTIMKRITLLLLASVGER
jgi:hypothetical protein